jgi:hypothetical protein
VSEKSITRQQRGRVRRAKNDASAPSSLDGACSGDKFEVSKAGQVYDAPESELNRKFQVNGRPSGGLPMKITLQYREQTRRVYYCAVFEIKRKFRLEIKNHVLWI